MIPSTSTNSHGTNTKLTCNNSENHTGRSHKSSKKPNKNQDQGQRGSNSYVDTVTLNRENGMSQEVSLKSHYLEKRSELQVLMEQRSLLVAEWTQRKLQYENERNSYLDTKEKSKQLKTDREKIEDKVDKLVGFIKQMKVWNNIIDDQDAHPTKGGPVTTNQSVVVTSSTAKLINPNAPLGRVIREIKPVPAASTLALATATPITYAKMEPKIIPIASTTNAITHGQIASSTGNVTIIVPAQPANAFTTGQIGHSTMLAAPTTAIVVLQGSNATAINSNNFPTI